MKKQLLIKTFLVAVSMLVGTSAWAESVSFSAKNRITDNGDGSWKTAGNAGNQYALAIADLSGVSGIADAGIVALEFDTKINSGGRWYIGIGDKSVRGTTACASGKGNYDTNGIIIRFRTGNGSTYSVNGEGSYSGFGITVHVTFTLNRITGKYSCILHDKTNDTDLYNVSDQSTTVGNATIVEAYSWNNNDETLQYLSDVTVTTTAAYSYTVNAVISGSSTVLKTMKGKVMPGEQAHVPYPKYINYNGTLYNKPATSNQYRYDFTPAANNETKEIEYTATDITNVIFYTEGEDIEGVTIQNNGGCYSRTSGCSTGVASNTPFVTLPAGSYKITVGYYNSNSGTSTVTISDGTNTVYTNGFSQNWNTYTSPENVILDGTKTLYATGGDSRANYPKGIDFIYVTGTFGEGADASCLIENPDMETTAGGSSYWQEGVKGWNNCSVVTNYRQLAFTVEQNPNNAFKGTNAFENWTDAAGGLVGQMSQTIKMLPNGVYKLQIAALVRTVNGQFIYGKSNGKTYKTSLSGANEIANDYTVFVVVEDNQLEIGLDMNGAGADWAVIDNVRLTFAPADATVPATIPTSGYGTIASAYPLDCANLPDDLKAYKVTELTTTTVTLQEVTTAVAAGTGLILKGTAGQTYDIPVVASGIDISETNKLKAAVTATTLADGSFYILKSGKFCKVENAADEAARTVPAGKAYLLASDVPSPDPARSLNFTFDATAIKAVESEAQNGEFYNVAGQRVAQPTKGLYIVNGKKIVVK